MPARAALQAFTRPLPRLLAEHARPSARSTPPAWLCPSGIASRFSWPTSSICFRCSIQAQIRRQSTTSSRPPDQPPKDAKTDTETTSADTTASSASASPEVEQPTLPSVHESARSALQARFSAFMDNLQSRILNATQTLNDLTGYTSIESIKAANTRLEAELAAAQARLRKARQNYKSLTNHRASTQREVTTLLARKDTWSPTDLERFTTLYRSDHELEASVAAAATELTEAEGEESKLGAALNAGILRRYHEEQVWSDRIRRQSTWGTWGLMGVNILLFIVLQFVAEPWRRRRLVKGFTEAESEVWEEVRKEVGEVRDLLLGVKEGNDIAAATAATAAAALPVAAEVSSEEPAAGEKAVDVTSVETRPSWQSWKEVILDFSRWKPLLADLYSDRRTDLRMRDASILALEGAATGAAIAAAVVFVLLRR